MHNDLSDQDLSCTVIIPTYNGKQDLVRLFKSLQSQTLQVPVVVVDSSSCDGTFEYAQQHAIRAEQISSAEFNHGGTRQCMANACQTDILVFLTQDAYLADNYALENLIAPFKNSKTGAVCGRQLPHLDATPVSAHARLFNYPAHSVVKSAADIPDLGVKAAFMSNSFAAYRREALIQVGGFPDNVILSEDMYVAAKMLKSGWNIVYESSARCHHSHNYTLLEEARRYFDIGAFFTQQAWLRQELGSPKGEGLRFIRSELKYLLKENPWSLPQACLRNFLKILFFELGKREEKLPTALKKKLSMHKRFWD